MGRQSYGSPMECLGYRIFPSLSTLGEQSFLLPPTRVADLGSTCPAWGAPSMPSPVDNMHGMVSFDSIDLEATPEVH